MSECRASVMTRTGGSDAFPACGAKIEDFRTIGAMLDLGTIFLGVSIHVRRGR